MTIDDRLEKSLAFLSEEAEKDTAKRAVAVVIAAIPHAGGSINQVLFGGGARRVAERAVDVFNAVKERLENVEESKIDKEFFKSDEFMTILFLTLEQLQTTHDKQKIEMLANGLANSGVVGFSSDSRKELFVRILRDLAPEHIQTLKGMRPNPKIPFLRPRTDPKGDDLSLLQTLAAHGLVEEYQEKKRLPSSISSVSSQKEARKALEDIIMALPIRSFRLNQFGQDFLAFFDAEAKASSSKSSGSQ